MNILWTAYESHTARSQKWHLDLRATSSQQLRRKRELLSHTCKETNATSRKGLCTPQRSVSMSSTLISDWLKTGAKDQLPYTQAFESQGLWARAGETAQTVKCLYCKYKDPNGVLTTHLKQPHRKPRAVVCVYNRSTGETGGSLGLAGRTACFTYPCDKPCLKRREKERRQGRKEKEKERKEEKKRWKTPVLCPPYTCTYM